MNLKAYDPALSKEENDKNLEIWEEQMNLYNKKVRKKRV